MDINKAVKLTKQYAKCLNCGSDNVGNGEGVFNIDENTFYRSCKCGWKIEIDTTDM